MAGRFDYFVMFAGMRTGSNFLEANLNTSKGLACLGEAFNPNFIGYPNRDALLGVSLAERDHEPGRVIDAVRASKANLGGFRFFHDHDPRVLDQMLDDPRCAKILLTRNPLQSYVSWKIAQATDQWKLTDVARRKTAAARFDAAEFEAYAATKAAFHCDVVRRVQAGDQTAFHLSYDDLRDLNQINGLIAWLGAGAPLTVLEDRLKPQNPGLLAEKVENSDDMSRALAEMDPFGLSELPGFEPSRGAGVRSFVAGHTLPLLHLPMPGSDAAWFHDWLTTLDGRAPDSNLTQKTLRQWKQAHPGHRSVTVIQHPLDRAHNVFCRRIVATGPDGYPRIRRHLRNRFGLELPDALPDAGYDRTAHRAAFLGFLSFLKANLAGQTAIRIDAEWGSQALAVAGFARICPPDVILRADEVGHALPNLARAMGRSDPASPSMPESGGPFALGDIHDAEIEKLAADIYRRDMVTFGFGNWREMPR